MSRIIGVTGIMGSGKTTLCKRLIEKNKSIKYINVDNFRLDLRINNSDFQMELLERVKGLTNLENINKYIYNDSSNMTVYKENLYKYLYKHLSEQMENQNQVIIIDWALIIDDNLLDWFDKIVLVTCSNEQIYKRLNNSYWPLSEIKNRIALQLSIDEKIHRLDQIKKEYLVINSEQEIDYDNIMDFIFTHD